MSNARERIILSMLMKNRRDYTSGNTLAEALGVSRVSIWAYFNQFREEGFEISAIRNRGYRIEREPSQVHNGLLHAYLDARGCDAIVHYARRVDSTNIEARRLLLADKPHPLFVISNTQSAGRGRLGRSWYGEDKGNLYITLAQHPNVAPERMAGYTLWMGLSLCRFLAEKYGADIKLKWPNDLILKGKKIGGMLVEGHVDSDTVYGMTFGLGLNINGSFAKADAQVREMAGSLFTQTGKRHNINAVAADIIECLAKANSAFFADESWRADLMQSWPQYDILQDKEIDVCDLKGVCRRALALGIDESGALKVRYEDDGSQAAVRSGDVTLRKPSQ